MAVLPELVAYIMIIRCTAYKSWGRPFLMLLEWSAVDKKAVESQKLK